ncbi:MAG: hypothetical protein V3U71_02540 [Cocleimonas sp.]
MSTVTRQQRSVPIKKSLFKRIIAHPGFIPLIFFLTALMLWLTFLSKVYVQNNNQKALLNTDPKLNEVVAQTNVETQDNSTKIQELTKQLMQQKEKTAELTRLIKVQQDNFGGLLDDALKKVSKNDKHYISELEKQVEKKSTATKPNKETITNTDYYNRVVVEPSTHINSQLQNQINQFFTEKESAIVNKVELNYVENLSKESDVRKNEVRSIALKKGESIWILAKRAYGDGFQYHKIMKANPHITEKSARFLAPGTMIRVPI